MLRIQDPVACHCTAWHADFSSSSIPENQCTRVPAAIRLLDTLSSGECNNASAGGEGLATFIIFHKRQQCVTELFFPLSCLVGCTTSATTIRVSLFAFGQYVLRTFGAVIISFCNVHHR